MASMNEKDYYAILGVSKDATNDEIRKAFQQKARKLHPDVNKEPDAEERFKEVSEAYAVLSDEDKRRRYDAMRSGSPFAAGYGPSPYANTQQGDPFAGSPYDWGFPFGTTSRRTTQSRAYRPKAGADIVYDLTINDETAARGGQRGLTYQRYATCTHCHGKGSVESAQAETCPTCKGSGRITLDLSSLFGFGVVDMTCPECEGSGRVVANPCEVCGGSGRVLTASEVIVDIPASCHDGDEVRVPNMGNAGTNGESTGDFVCRVGVPSEQVTPAQARGFYDIGLAVPFMLVGLITGSIMSTVWWWAVLIIIGVLNIVRGGSMLGHNSRWWQNAMSAFLSGSMAGTPIAVLLLLMFSCNSALMSSR